MSVYHKHCGGEIGWKPPWPFPPRCKKCGKRWSPFVIYNPMPPGDMRFVAEPKPVRVRSTSYARWGDKLPFVPNIAGRLPNWPKWARILTGGIFIGGMLFLMYWVFTTIGGMLT